MAVDPSDFAARAKEGLAAADAFAAGLGKMGEASDAVASKLAEAKSELQKLQSEANKELFARNPIAKAKHDVAELTSEFQKLQKAQQAALKESTGGAGGAGLEKAASALGKSFSEGEGHATAAGSALSLAGGALSAGASFVLEAAQTIGKEALHLIEAGVEFGIKETANRQKQSEILDKLTHGQGGLAYEVSLQLAGETGIDPKVAGERVKALIAAKFDRKDTEILFHASADLDQVKAGAGEAFLASLENMSHRGKATERDMRALGHAGVDLQEIYAGLKKPGETIAEVETRLKAGTIAAADFAHASAAAIEKDYGGTSGKGLDAGINRAKIGLGKLFDDFDLTPLDELGSKLDDALKGSEGAQLKKSITEAGDAVTGLVKNISKEDIKTAFVDASSAAHELAGYIESAGNAASALYKTSKGLADTLGYLDPTGTVDKVFAGTADKSKGPREIEDPAAGKIYTLKDDAGKEGHATGAAIADGLAKGVDDNAGKVASAVDKAVGGAIDAGNRKAGVHSPSTVAAETGMYYDKGLELGLERYAGGPERAAAGVAERMTRAGGRAAGGAPGGAGAGAGSGNIAIHYAPQIIMAPGSPAENRAAVAAGFAEDYPRFLSFLRQALRDKRELVP